MSERTPHCESCERLDAENGRLRGAVAIWQKLADERKEQIAAQSERLIALSEIEPWIMTADRMPPHGEDVLFLTSSGRWFGWRRQEKGDWLDSFNDEPICADADVLCWMPIPAIPEKLKVTHEQMRTIAER